jgi:superfamily II DNA or RNA helicase
VKLRPYQQRSETKVFGAWDAGLQRIAISIATGGGKTPTLVSIARRHIRNSSGPVVLLAHRRELIKQAAKHFRNAGPDLNVEVVLGNPGPRNSKKRAVNLHNWRNADVLVTTVQTLGSADTLREFPNPTLIIVDEAHRSMAAQYTKVLTALGAFSGTRLLGVTATPFREDHREFSDTYQAIVDSVDIGWLITHKLSADGTEDIECAPGEGYLIPPDLQHLLIDGLDLSQVPMSRMNGTLDFKDSALADELMNSGAFDKVVEVITNKYAHRKGGIFAPTIESSKYLAELMTAAGLPCIHVDGTMKTAERDKLLKDYATNKVRWMSNVNIITEGFDVPDMDMVVLARPTQSRIFFRQSIGRCLRPSDGKIDAIVLDMAGASDGMSLAGVEALTDADVLTAEGSESLSDLLSRSDRERRGRYDRIRSHASRAMELQNRAERNLEQIRLTGETFLEKLPGLAEFVTQATPRHHVVLDHTTAAVDRFEATSPDMTLSELEDAESFVASRAAAASKALAGVDEVKAAMRSALATLKEDPTSAVAQALITGELRTVRGNLFGEEAERYKPGTPGDVGELKTRNGKVEKVRSYARYGWAQETPKGNLYVPIHDGDRDPSAFAVAVRIGDDYQPVLWDSLSGSADDFACLMSLDDAYVAIVEKAAETTTAPNLINPNAAWRAKQATDKARAYARRVNPQVEQPDTATAGCIADIISDGKYGSRVDKLAAWVDKQLAAVTS